MNRPESTGLPDVLVVGAGVIGLAAAWRLAQKGAQVQVVDPAPGTGASGVAAGMLAPVTEARLGEEALLRLGVASWSRWPDFAAELGGRRRIGYRADGTVQVALDADDRALLSDLVDRQRSLGLEVEDLSATQVRELEPALAPGIRRGALAAGERSVEPSAVVDALLDLAVAAGVAVRRSHVAAVIALGGDPEVELASGERLVARTVLLAAGAWSPDLVRGAAGPPIPVRPVKGQVLTLRQRTGDRLVHHNVRGLVRGSSVYLVPRDDGRVVCGATVEEQGWDAVPTAGAAYELLRDVLTLIPGLDEAELIGVKAGFRPGTPDDLPLIGPSGIPGLVLATGHYRNGVLLAPITAEAVVRLLMGETLPPEVLPCDPRRFATEAVVAP